MSRDEDLNHFKRVFPVCLLKNCLALATYAHSKFLGTNSWYPLLSFVLVAWHHPVSHTILCTDCMVSAIADAARLQARASWSWTSKIKHWRISHGFPDFNLQGETKHLLLLLSVATVYQDGLTVHPTRLSEQMTLQHGPQLCSGSWRGKIRRHRNLVLLSLKTMDSWISTVLSHLHPFASNHQ
jgi:hypothetical protein